VWRSFVLVPFVATLTWYVLILAALGVGNGQLRWAPDILAMGIGAVVYGLPVAVIVTMAAAVPGYLLVGRMRHVMLPLALAAGALIGFASWALFWSLTGESTVLSPMRGPAIGVATAAAWWYTGGKSSN
jgi:hypothetical protein